MNALELTFELLKIILPALVVYATVYHTLKTLYERDRDIKRLEIRKASNELTLPIKLQAFERMTLFIERINPNSMITRVYETGMTARDLQSKLLYEIKQEFEHNFTQQLYISKTAWDAIVTVKEETVHLINQASNSLPAQATGLDLSRKILNHQLSLEKDVYNITIQILKSEIQNTL
jgi:hypothetical protein